MSYDASARALRCPFCGSEELESRPDVVVIAPKRIVPFALSREEAVVAMRQWLGQGFWRPGDLSEQALVVKMTPVYVPYWIFEATTHTYWTADTNQLPVLSRGDWRPLSGAHHGRHTGLVVGASSALSARETNVLCPFDLAAAVPPEAVDLDNVTVEQFQVMRKYARPLARQGLETLEAQACEARYVPGRCRKMQVNTRLEGLTSEPVLVPVWIMAYHYRNRPFRFLVNGQTGRATGAAPTSYRKIAGAIGIAILVGLGLLALLAFLGR